MPLPFCCRLAFVSGEAIVALFAKKSSFVIFLVLQIVMKVCFIFLTIEFLPGMTISELAILINATIFLFCCIEEISDQNLENVFKLVEAY